jgi:hypothetical protein
MSKEFLGVDFWRQHVDQYHREGIGQAAYCRQHDLVVHRFGYWYRKLSSGQSSSWLPVEIKQTQKAVTAIDLVLGSDRIVRVTEGFDARLLKQIIATVESTP